MEELQELLKLEIRQQLPGYTLEDFHTEAFPMAARLDGTEMMLAISIEKNFVMLAEQVLGELQLPLVRTGVSQMAAHSALMYNYPEHARNTVMVLGVQDQYMDVSVVRQGKLAYYNLVSLPSKQDIGQVCEREMQKLLAQYVPFIDAAFLFGAGLAKPALEAAQQAIPVQVERLNTFRMMKSTLDERERQYSSRVAHIFPACIGGALPLLQEGIHII
jgi:hypothetical protein